MSIHTVAPATSKRPTLRAKAAAVAVAAAIGLAGFGAPAAFGTGPSVTNVNNNYSVPQGGQWTFQGTGFAWAAGQVTVYLDAGTTVLGTFNVLDDQSADPGHVVTTAGSYTTRVPVPLSTTVGDHTLSFTQGGVEVASVEIDVLATTATVTVPASAAPGETVAVAGSGWPVNSTVNVRIDADPNMIIGTFATTETGDFASDAEIVIPGTTSLGDHLLTFLAPSTSVSEFIEITD